MKESPLNTGLRGPAKYALILGRSYKFFSIWRECEMRSEEVSLLRFGGREEREREEREKRERRERKEREKKKRRKREKRDATSIRAIKSTSSGQVAVYFW